MKKEKNPFSITGDLQSFSVNGQNESKLFLDTLWGDFPPDGVICIWINAYENPNYFHHSKKDDLVSHVQTESLKKNVYFSVGMQKEPLPGRQRGTADTVVAIPGLWLDLDIKDPVHSREDLIPSIEVAMDFLAQFPLRPSMIVHSGYGLHCYWILKEPWIFDSEKEKQEAVKLSQRFQETLKIAAGKHDWWIDNTSDLARLLRVPGTTNHKNSTPMSVYIVERNDNRYNPDDFEEFLVDDLMNCPGEELGVEVKSEGSETDNSIEQTDGYTVNQQVTNELVNQCDFLQHCKKDAANLSEPEWHSMICVLAHEHGGYDAIHEISRPYPRYSKQETDQYILKALKRSNAPLTCDAIKKHWNCNIDCGVNSPIHLKQGILKEMGIIESPMAAVETTDSDNTEDESFSDIDLLKERIPDVSFPWTSLPPYLADSLKDLAEDMVVHPEMCGVIALGILSSAIGSVVKSVEAKKGYKSSVNLWTAIIAGTGEKKTPVFNRLMKPVHEYQKQLLDKFKVEHQDWEKRQNTSQKGGNDDPEPKRPSLYTTDPTIEALIELLDENRHGIMLFQDEISGFLLSFDKYRGGKGGDREQYLSLWSGTPIKVDRVSKKLYVYDPFLSLLGGLQPGKAVRLFGEDSFDDGLITRFIFYHNPDISKKLSQDTWHVEYEKKWAEMITHFYSMSNGLKLELKLDDDAWQVFVDYYNSLTALSPFVPVRFQVFLPKAKDYVLRISGLLHVLEAAFIGQPVSPFISKDTVTRAVNLVNYFLSQARQIVELYGPKKPEINMDSRHALASIVSVSVSENENRTKLTTEEIHAAFNNNVPVEAQIKSIIKFGKLVVKTLEEFKIKFKKDRLHINGENRQGFIFEEDSLESIKKLLE